MRLKNTRPIPDQPMEEDEQGKIRFIMNPLVRYLLDNGELDMNALQYMPATDREKAQFAQLIGYSLVGYSELPYVTSDDLERLPVIE